MPDLDLAAIREKHADYLRQLAAQKVGAFDLADELARVDLLTVILVAEKLAAELQRVTGVAERWHGQALGFIAERDAARADLTRLAAQVRVLTSERDGLLRDRDGWKRIAERGAPTCGGSEGLAEAPAPVTPGPPPEAV